MPQKRYTVYQIVAKLRKADVELGKGTKMPEVCKLLGVTEQTCCRWRQKYGGMQPEMCALARQRPPAGGARRVHARIPGDWSWSFV